MSQEEQGYIPGETLVLTCKVADYHPDTGVCDAPFFGYPPTVFPYLSAADGAEIAFLIIGMWTLGVIARAFIRSTQQERTGP